MRAYCFSNKMDAKLLLFGTEKDIYNELCDILYTHKLI